MSTRFSRRTVLASAGIGALSAAGLHTARVRAQTTSPYAFPSGMSLTWATPWTMSADNTATEIVADSVGLATETKGELIVGFYDAATTIDEVAKAFLTFLVQDPTLAPGVSGGEETTTDTNGAVTAEMAYQVHSLKVDDESYGIFLQLINSTDLTILVAPEASFATEFDSAHSSIQLDGVAVLAGVDGTEVQADLEGFVGTSGTAAASETYVIPTGNITVAWAKGWTVVSQNEVGIELTDSDNAGVLAISGHAIEGKTWQQLAEADVEFLNGDQGANATLTGPTVTDSGYSFTTDGDYGLRLVQGSGSDDPTIYILTFAHQLTAKGTEAVDWLKAAQTAVTINGAVPLEGLETLIDTIAG